MKNKSILCSRLLDAPVTHFAFELNHIEPNSVKNWQIFIGLLLELIMYCRAQILFSFCIFYTWLDLNALQV